MYRRVLLLVILGGPAAAADVGTPPLAAGFLSIEETIERLLETGPGAQDIAAEVELAGLDLEQVRTGYRVRPYAFLNTDARSGADTGHTFSAGLSRKFEAGSRWTVGMSNSAFGNSYLSEVTVGYTLPMFRDPLTSGQFALQDAELAFRSRELRAVLATESLVLDGIRSYYEVALAQANIEVAEGATALAERLERATAIRFEAGRASQLDRQLARLRVAEERQRELAAQAALDAALTRLRGLLGADPGEVLAVDPEIPVTTGTDAALLDEASLMQRALTQRRDFLALQSDAEFAGRRVSSRSTGFPGFDVTLQYARVGEGESFGESNNLDDSRIGIGIAVDLVGEGSVNTEARRALIQYRNQRRALGRLETGIRGEVAAALFAVRDTAARLRLSRQGRSLAQQQLRMAETLYMKGTGTTEEMLDRQRTLLEARQGELTARVDLLLAHYQLQAVTGSLLEQWQH